MTAFLWNCGNEEALEKIHPDYIKIKNTAEYMHDFKITGDEEGATIKLQATHFSISEIIRNESTNWNVLYHYKPELGYVGTDSVKIETSTGSNGASPGNIKLIEFFFLITD